MFRTASFFRLISDSFSWCLQLALFYVLHHGSDVFSYFLCLSLPVFGKFLDSTTTPQSPQAQNFSIVRTSCTYFLHLGDSPVLCRSTQSYGTHMHAKAEISKQLSRASTSVSVLCDSSTESPAWCSSSQTTELHPSSVFELYFVAPWHAASSSHAADRQAPGSNKHSRASKPGWLTEKIKKKRGSPSSHEQEGSRVLCQVLGTRFQPPKKRNRAQRVCTRVRLNMEAADGVLSNHGW